jgi:hypothetical protein
MNFIVKKPFSTTIARIPSFITNTSYSTEVIGIDLVGCAPVTRTLYTPSLIVVKNCGMNCP